MTQKSFPQFSNVVYFEIARKYFYQDGFTQLGNWKTMFWIISQEQHGIKTQNLLKLIAIFIALLMKKTYLAFHLTSV